MLRVIKISKIIIISLKAVIYKNPKETPFPPAVVSYRGGVASPVGAQPPHYATLRRSTKR